MLKFYIKVLYVMGKTLSGELSCMETGLVRLETCFRDMQIVQIQFRHHRTLHLIRIYTASLQKCSEMQNENIQSKIFEPLKFGLQFILSTVCTFHLISYLTNLKFHLTKI